MPEMNIVIEDVVTDRIDMNAVFREYEEYPDYDEAPGIVQEDQLYSRQQELELNIPPEVTIVGCGGIGSWVAIYAAMTGVDTLYLFDPDVVENSNRNRLPFCEGAIGRPKVEVVADFIHALRPDIKVFGIRDKMTEIILEAKFATFGGYLIDCTDSPKTQIMLYRKCKDHLYPYIRAGYDGTSIMVTSHVSGWIKVDSEEEHYQINPSWVVPASIVAALAVAKMVKFPIQEVGLDISEIGVPVVQKERRLSARCSQLADKK